MLDYNKTLEKEETLDPENWEQLRQLAHNMVDDMMSHLQTVAERPVWVKTPDDVKTFLNQPLPQQPTDTGQVYDEFKQYILPYNKGNVHPRFWSWVQGTGTAFGMMADMLASGMNPNNTIGDHAPMYVESQVIDWCKTMMGFPSEGSGLLLSGGSMANITAIITARNWFDESIRKQGLYAVSGQLTMYCSTETHNCLVKAADAVGIGQDNLRKIVVNDQYQIDTQQLRQQLAADRVAGFVPFCIVGNAGTVNTGAIDDLDELRHIATEQNLWLHIDGAFGALAKLVPAYQTRLKAIEKADSVAFDLHKWMYMNYEVGCVLIRDKQIHRNAFAVSANYLLNHERGLSAGPDPKANYGLELSRGFKALKVWMSLKEHGIEKYARLIEQNIAQAYYLESLILENPDLELLAPVTMNVVCFRFNPKNKTIANLSDLNKEILMQLHIQGVAAPSYTLLNGNYTIRVANVNHRSTKSDFDALVADVLRIGVELNDIASSI